ncbi:MAG: hypothetical protein GX885_07875 [Methanomicrobiales archaeon]|nr:hypothetical protein [Methanomicrobiales archaeon]
MIIPGDPIVGAAIFTEVEKALMGRIPGLWRYRSGRPGQRPGRILAGVGR